MKNQHYFCRNKIWIIATLWLFAGCYDSDSWVNVVEEPAKVQVTLTAEEAQASFENEIMKKRTCFVFPNINSLLAILSQSGTAV